MKTILLSVHNDQALTNVGALCFGDSKSFCQKAYELETEQMKYSWPMAVWEKSVSDASLILFFMGEKSFALFQKHPLDPVLHLLKIVVDQSLRGSGQASLLIHQSILITNALHSDIESVYLEVEEENLRAQKFYLKNGFQIIHKKKGFYSDGSGAFIMQKKLSVN